MIVTPDKTKPESFYCVVELEPEFRLAENGETEICIEVTRQTSHNITTCYTLVDRLTVNNAPFYQTVRPGTALSVNVEPESDDETSRLTSVEIGKMDSISEEILREQGETPIQAHVRVNDFGAVQPKDIAKLVS